MGTPAASASVLKVAGTAEGGYCIRVEGRGTMRESRSAGAFAAKPLEQPGTRVVVDLSACDYLDSTFLGCLVDLHRRAGRSDPPRFLIAAPPETVRKLLGPTRLDTVIRTTAEAPTVIGEYVALPAVDPSSPDVMEHVMQCHRLLAGLGGPQKGAFAAIADNIERELRKGAGAGGPAAGG